MPQQSVESGRFGLYLLCEVLGRQEQKSWSVYEGAKQTYASKYAVCVHRGISKNGVVRKKGKKNLALFGTRHIRTTGWTQEVKEGEDKKVRNELEEHKLLVTCSPHSQASDNGKAINAHEVWYGIHPFRWRNLVCLLMSHLVGHILIVSGQYTTLCCLSAVWLWAWNVLSNSLAKFYTSFSSDVEFSEKRIKKKKLFGEYHQLCSKLVQGAGLLYSNLQWSTRGRVERK